MSRLPRRQWHHLYRRQLVDGLCCATGLRPGEAEADVYSKPIALISTIIGIGMAFACGALAWCAVRLTRPQKKT